MKRNQCPNKINALSRCLLSSAAKRLKCLFSVGITAALLLSALALPASAANNTTIDTTGFAAEVLRLVNRERASANLPTLSGGLALLSSAAQQRASETARPGFWSHTRPNGKSGLTVLRDYGLAPGVNYFKAGENIAYGYASPADVVAGWMSSTEGHRENILGNYTHLGVGVAERNGTLYWVQLFLHGTDASLASLSPAKKTTESFTFLDWILYIVFFGWIWM
jgi:uncharacterized protein YkwD